MHTVKPDNLDAILLKNDRGEKHLATPTRKRKMETREGQKRMDGEKNNRESTESTESTIHEQ